MVEKKSKAKKTNAEVVSDEPSIQVNIKPGNKGFNCFSGSECKPSAPCSSGGAVYGLGLIGALVYFISTATGFWMGVLGILKSLVWPAFLVYGLLKFLGM
jgi:hypothetical protein